ncbi:hypothetical protein PR048_021260 [Dryococelus australis]|uniref:Uncharacterized protein n=1 Tax=Dryococelus australis TaxID=614101 RepID=A0ABQ9GXR2_9NEOP|nr:hypothetical protein PR048_021260 [Dryococelus australis]
MWPAWRIGRHGLSRGGGGGGPTGWGYCFGRSRRNRLGVWQQSYHAVNQFFRSRGLRTGSLTHEAGNLGRAALTPLRDPARLPSSPLVRRDRGGVVARRLVSQLGEPGSIAGGFGPGFFAYGNRAGRCRWSAGFLEGSPFTPLIPLAFHVSLPDDELSASASCVFDSRAKVVSRVAYRRASGTKHKNIEAVGSAPGFGIQAEVSSGRTSRTRLEVVLGQGHRDGMATDQTPMDTLQPLYQSLKGWPPDSSVGLWETTSLPGYYHYDSRRRCCVQTIYEETGLACLMVRACRSGCWQVALFPGLPSHDVNASESACERKLPPPPPTRLILFVLGAQIAHARYPSPFPPIYCCATAGCPLAPLPTSRRLIYLSPLDFFVVSREGPTVVPGRGRRYKKKKKKSSAATKTLGNRWSDRLLFLLSQQTGDLIEISTIEENEWKEVRGSMMCGSTKLQTRPTFARSAGVHLVNHVRFARGADDLDTMLVVDLDLTPHRLHPRLTPPKTNSTQSIPPNTYFNKDRLHPIYPTQDLFQQRPTPPKTYSNKDRHHPRLTPPRLTSPKTNSTQDCLHPRLAPPKTNSTQDYFHPRLTPPNRSHPILISTKTDSTQSIPPKTYSNKDRHHPRLTPPRLTSPKTNSTQDCLHPRLTLPNTNSTQDWFLTRLT